MSSLDIFGMAFRNLLKRKLRTFLTVLGVVIGTAAIVVMISLGIGMNESFIEQLQYMGDITTINVYKPYDYGGFRVVGGGVAVSVGGGSGSSNETPVLDDAAMATILNMPGVTAATPFLELDMPATSGRYEGYLQIRGVRPDAMEALGYAAKEGRLLEDTDKLQVVYGYEVPFYFYNPNDRYGGWYGWWDGVEEDTRVPPIDVLNDKVTASFSWGSNYESPYDNNDTLQVPDKKYKFDGVGRLEPKGYMVNGYVYMNITQAQKIKAEKEKYESQFDTNNSSGNNRKQDKGYDQAMVKCDSIDDVTEVLQSIRNMGFEAQAPAEQLDAMKEISASLQALLGAIGGVSLFIAAIGITNTMIMAIYERTREIGVMKVIGATLGDIGKLFLLEAALIGIFGGLLGVLLSLGVSFLLNNFEMSIMMISSGGSTVSVIPPWLSLLALCFSSGIGLISGYFPARRAMKLSALSAIRTE